MAGGEGAGRHSRARAHSIYCTARERAAIGKRAEAAGMRFSPFVVACGLQGEDDEGTGIGHALVLAEEQQEELHQRIALLDRCNEAMLRRLPGMDMSMLGALAFLVEASRGGSGGGAADE